MKISLFFRILSVLLVFFPSFIYASEPEETLVIEFKDGNKKELLFLSDKPVIRFEGSTLVVRTRDFMADLTDIACFRFEKRDKEYETSIESLESDNKFVVSYTTPNTVVFYGPLVGKMCISTLDGRSVQADIIIQEGQTIVNLESLGSGIYIIKANNQSYKIVKK